MVHSESQENGQKEAKRSRHEELEEDDAHADRERTREHEDKIDASFPEAMETQSPSDASHDVEINTGNRSVTLYSEMSMQIVIIIFIVGLTCFISVSLNMLLTKESFQMSDQFD